MPEPSQSGTGGARPGSATRTFTPQPASDDRDLPDLPEITPERLAGIGSKLDKNPAAVVGIGTPNENALRYERLEPPERGRGGNGGGDAEARNRNPQLRDFRLQQMQELDDFGSRTDLSTGTAVNLP